MKTKIPRLLLLVICGVLSAASSIQAQESLQPSLPSTIGTVARYTPDSLVINITGSNTPLVYSYTKATTYVDENGTTVPSSSVQAGVPVAVYYEAEGEKLTARKIVVGATTQSYLPTTGIVSVGKPGEVVPAETGIPIPAPSPVAPVPEPTPDSTPKTGSAVASTEGSVVWVSSNEIQIKTAASNNPVAIGYDSATTYLNDKGKAISLEAINPGQQVIVQYDRMGDSLIASQVILRTEIGANEPSWNRNRTSPQNPDTDATKTSQPTMEKAARMK